MKKIQSVLFPRKEWTQTQAVAYLRRNGYKHNKVDATQNYYRFRQRPPNSSKYNYYTGHLTTHIGKDKKSKVIKYVYYFSPT